MVGTGALATLFAARLGQAGNMLHMLGTWKPGLDALRENGARVLEDDGEIRSVKVHATDDLHEVAGIKYCIVLVKSWQTERAAQQLKEVLAPEGHVLTLQNGLGNCEILQKSLGVHRVSQGVTTTGATLVKPGLVKLGGEGIVSIEKTDFLAPFEKTLRDANFNIEIVKDARSLVWGKLVINTAINPLTALLRIPNGELLNRPPLRKIMAALAIETARVAAAECVKLPFVEPVNAVEEVIRKTAKNYSSMLQDVMRGTPTEIDFICGAVTQRGAFHGLSTPYNRACWRLVRSI